MKTNFILLGIASIIVILVMSAKKKEAFREGQTIRYKSVAGGNRPAANPAAFKSFMSRTRPGRGYCERNIGSLWGFNNASVCRGGTNRNIARHIRIQFVEPQGRLWEVQAGVDAGNGGFIELLTLTTYRKYPFTVSYFRWELFVSLLCQNSIYMY